MNPAPQFTRWLLDLDDTSFFAVVRNYLGPVRTPYNKHELIQKLTAFLVHGETERRIAARMDTHDRRTLAAVLLLGNPDMETLHRFLGITGDEAALHRHIMNLQDRLLLLRADQHLMINPVLEPLVRRTIRDPRFMVGGRRCPEGSREQMGRLPWLDTRLAAAMVSLIHEDREFFTRSGTVRRTILRRLTEASGELFQGSSGEQRLRTVLAALETLELIHRRDTTITVRRDAWDELADLPDRWIHGVLWGAALTTSLHRAWDYAALLLELTTALPHHRCWSAEEMVRLIMVAPQGRALPVDIDLPQRLVHLDLLLYDDAQGVYSANPAVSHIVAESSGSMDTPPPPVVVSAAMTITCPPGVPLAHMLVAARLAPVAHLDVMLSFTLREEVFLALPREDRDTAVEDLQRLAGEMPQSVRFLLEQWQRRAGSLRLLRGVILKLAGDNRELLEQDSAFQRCCRETLAPGVYLIREDRLQELEKLLHHRGVAPSLQVEEPLRVDATVPDHRALLERYRQPSLLAPRPLGEMLRSDLPGEDTSETPELPGAVVREQPSQEELASHLATLQLPEEVERELALRIERKLILFPEQLRGEIVPQAGMEARGLDYLGKIRMVEQAISARELLEVIMRTSQGSPQRLLLQPRELVQEHDDVFLRALQLPGNDAVRIRIRRASLVRRLSGTLLRHR